MQGESPRVQEVPAADRVCDVAADHFRRRLRVRRHPSPAVFGANDADVGSRRAQRTRGRGANHIDHGDKRVVHRGRQRRPVAGREPQDRVHRQLLWPRRPADHRGWARFLCGIGLFHAFFHAAGRVEVGQLILGYRLRCRVGAVGRLGVAFLILAGPQLAAGGELGDLQRREELRTGDRGEQEFAFQHAVLASMGTEKRQVRILVVGSLSTGEGLFQLCSGERSG